MGLSGLDQLGQPCPEICKHRIDFVLAQARVMAVEQRIVSGQPERFAFGLTDLLLKRQYLNKMRLQPCKVTVPPGLAPNHPGTGDGP